MAETGTRIGNRYRIIRLLDSGGMAAVYLAHDSRLGEKRAIKEVVCSFQNGIQMQSLFREADILRHLHHPSLPKITDIICERNNMYIVMEYIEGISLQKYIQKREILPEQVLNWMEQLCKILIYLHNQEPPVFHRDIKPSNIMIKPDGKLVLIDFGISFWQICASEGNGEVWGTKGYAAPDQIRGKMPDARSDIYSVGVTMHRVLNSVPFGRLRYLEKIAEKCMQKDVRKRFQNCRILLLRLKIGRLILWFLKKRSRKVAAAFMTMGIFTFLCGVFWNFHREHTAYIHLCEEAEHYSEKKEREEYLEQLILTYPEEMRAYELLFNSYKQDMCFDSGEEIQAVRCLEGIRGVSSIYSGLAYEVGKLYWYYYQKNEEGISLEGMKKAVLWFDDAVHYGKKRNKWREEAALYGEIGKFHRDITIQVQEEEEQGMYAHYWTVLAEFSKQELDEKMRRELYRLLLYSLENYAEKFHEDGVEYQEMQGILSRIQEVIEDVKFINKTDKIEGKYLKKRFFQAQKAVENVQRKEEIDEQKQMEK